MKSPDNEGLFTLLGICSVLVSTDEREELSWADTMQILELAGGVSPSRYPGMWWRVEVKPAPPVWIFASLSSPHPDTQAEERNSWSCAGDLGPADWLGGR